MPTRAVLSQASAPFTEPPFHVVTSDGPVRTRQVSGSLRRVWPAANNCPGCRARRRRGSLAQVAMDPGTRPRWDALLEVTSIPADCVGSARARSGSALRSRRAGRSPAWRFRSPGRDNPPASTRRPISSAQPSSRSDHLPEPHQVRAQSSMITAWDPRFGWLPWPLRSSNLERQPQLLGGAVPRYRATDPGAAMCPITTTVTLCRGVSDRRIGAAHEGYPEAQRRARVSGYSQSADSCASGVLPDAPLRGGRCLL
jgi:bacterioferritin-associated ferredoxin